MTDQSLTEAWRFLEFIGESRDFPGSPTLNSLIVGGYKSISNRSELEITPLTLLAGANSSGKSSMLQPLLLLKQTFEAQYDPGPLMLSGSNVQFTKPDQMVSVLASEEVVSIGATLARGNSEDSQREVSGFCNTYRADEGIDLESTAWSFFDGSTFELHAGKNYSLLDYLVDRSGRDSKADDFLRRLREAQGDDQKVTAIRHRGLIALPWLYASAEIAKMLRQVIHVPGLRGEPRRTYPTTAVGATFPGTFLPYTASVIQSWQTTRDSRLGELAKHLRALGLTWKADVKPIDATQVELRVGRLPKSRRGGARDLVNVADVGFGVSQVLPVLVALLVAEPGTLVYLEQPELHLHPRAQVALAPILAAAAERDVRVVVETHSAFLLLALQALVAEEKLPSELVNLHWFQRDEDGATEISSTSLDDMGAYGDWPVDFGAVEAQLENRYLNAVEKQLKKQGKL